MRILLIFSLILGAILSHAQSSEEFAGFIYVDGGEQSPMKARLVKTSYGSNILHLDSFGHNRDTTEIVNLLQNFLVERSRNDDNKLKIDTVHTGGESFRYDGTWKVKELGDLELEFKNKSRKSEIDNVELLREKDLVLSYVYYYCEESPKIYNEKEECERKEPCDECEGEIF